MLAISRLHLANIRNVSISWMTQGPNTCQFSLRFGANDVGSIMIEENVISAAASRSWRRNSAA